MATSAARPSCSRSSTLTTMVAIMPATADELRGAFGPVSSGSFSVKAMERSLSCCSTSILATEALQISSCPTYFEIVAHFDRMNRSFRSCESTSKLLISAIVFEDRRQGLTQSLLAPRYRAWYHLSHLPPCPTDASPWHPAFFA